MKKSRKRKLISVRKAILFAAIVLIGSGSSYAIGLSGANMGQIITEARCRSGAFLVHSTGKTHSETDDDSKPAANLGGLTATTTGTTTLIGPNLITNGGLEDRDHDGNPTGWLSGASGKTKAKFTLVPGHNSTIAVRTDVSSYDRGHAADWYSEAFNVSPGAYYQYRDYYRSNVASRAVLMTENKAGQRTYTDLVSAAANSHWAEYTSTFFVPADAVHARISHQLAGVGVLEVDDVSLNRARPDGFNRALVSITFDDGWRSIHDNALPLLDRYNMVSTQYIISGYVGQAQNYLSAKEIYDLRTHGNEIASHTVNHDNLANEPREKVEYELTTAGANLNKCFSHVTDYAAPYGTYSPDTLEIAKGLYQTYRTTDSGFNTFDSFNPYYLTVQNVDAHTTQDQIKAWLQIASQNHAWLILVYHQVDLSSSDYARQPAVLEQDLQTIKVSGVTVKTVAGAYAEIKPQVGK